MCRVLGLANYQWVYFIPFKEREREGEKEKDSQLIL